MDATQRIFERSLNPMLIADDGRRYVDANAAACRLLGLTREEILRLKVDDLTPPDRRGAVAALWESFRKEGSQAGRFELLLPDATRLEVAFSATADIAPGRHLTIFMTPSTPELNGEPDDARPASLTPREREILSLVALGITGEEIAECLVISAETVRTHLRNARAKLGAKTKAHAVALALSRGLLRL